MLIFLKTKEPSAPILLLALWILHCLTLCSPRLMCLVAGWEVWWQYGKWCPLCVLPPCTLSISVQKYNFTSWLHLFPLCSSFFVQFILSHGHQNNGQCKFEWSLACWTTCICYCICSNEIVENVLRKRTLHSGSWFSLLFLFRFQS